MLDLPFIIALKAPQFKTTPTPQPKLNHSDKMI